MSEVTAPEAYKEKIEEVLGGEFVDDRMTLSIEAETVEDAQLLKKKILQQQKELRQIKREINQDMKVIRAHFKERSANVQPSTTSILAGLFGKRGYSKSEVAQKRRELMRERDNYLVPYDGATMIIADLLVQLDGAKLAITNYINDNR